MDIKIEAQLNSLKLTSSAPASKEWEEKFLLKENHAKILAWCKDHHVQAFWNSVDKKSELVQMLSKANHNSFGLLDKLHTEFMLFVGKLPSDECCLEKSNVSEDRRFVKDALEHWDGTEDIMYSIAGAVVLGKSKTDREYIIGYVHESLLKQMFEAWLQVYDK